MLALCAAHPAYLAGLESALSDAQSAGGTALVGGIGAPLAAMLRRNGEVATTLDEHADIMAAVEGALSSGVVLGSAPVAQLLEDRGCDAVLPFKSGARLWTMAEWQHLRVLASPHRLTPQLENKLELAELAAAADARIPDTVTVHLDQALADAAVTTGIALPRVYQPAVGFAGAGTVLLETPEDVVRLVADTPPKQAMGKLVEFVAGEPVTVNGVVIPPSVHGAGEDGEVLVGMVARQLTGLAGLTPTDFGSCGNDWAQPPSRDDVAAVRALAHRIGEVLCQRGFAGAFGIDVVLPERGGVPVLIEINPRWTASLALQVELQQRQGLPTLLDAHLAAFAYHPELRPSLGELLAAFGPDHDAGCTRSVEPVSTILAYNATDMPVRIDDTFEPGVWRVTLSATAGAAGPPTIERVRDGWRLSDLDETDTSEVLLLPTGPGRDVEPGSYLVRIILRGASAATPLARVLRPDVAALALVVVTAATSGN
ncbi:MAG: ATP-grasp domain-containing protein [Thermoleophilia bacterium]|nr:ATP-grasp domain-containing protein [Thermoleophilia bacterium]